MDDWKTAIQHYKETLEKYPNSRHANRAAHRIGLLYRFAGEYENALIWLRKQRELYSNKLNSQRALFEQGAVYFLDIKDYQKAIEVFQQYISEYPDDEHTWPAYRCMAKCYENTDNTSQAIAVLQEALNKLSGSKYVDAIKAKLDKIQEGGEK